MKRAKAFVLFVLFAAFVLPAAAAAQETGAPTTDEERAQRARELFTEGVSLAGEHHYAEAAERFRQALTLRDAPTIRYNLASTLFEEREITEAHEIATALLAMSDLPDAVRAPTQALELQINAAGGFVRAELPDGLEAADLTVDDHPIADPHEEFAVMPGRHTVRAVVDGTPVAQGVVEVGSGVHRTVQLEHVEVHEPGPEGPITDQWWFWTAIGGGVVLLGVIIGVAAGVADQNAHAPISGNFSPGVISW